MELTTLATIQAPLVSTGGAFFVPCRPPARGSTDRGGHFVHRGSASPARAWIIRNQFGRRNLLPYIRTKLALELRETIAARAGNRMKAGKKPDPTQISAGGETRQQLAAIAGVSHDTVGFQGRGGKESLMQINCV